jgi:hypothetical protein
VKCAWRHACREVKSYRDPTNSLTVTGEHTCAQLVEPRLLRVVTGAHRVKVVALHQQHIGLQQLRRHHMPQDGVVFVQIDAAHGESSAVHSQHPRGGDLHGAQADPAGL